MKLWFPEQRGAYIVGNGWAYAIWCGTVLSHIISQLRPGADLSRVVLPTFILEPRSMLERITKRVFNLPTILASANR